MGEPPTGGTQPRDKDAKGGGNQVAGGTPGRQKAGPAGATGYHKAGGEGDSIGGKEEGRWTTRGGEEGDEAATDDNEATTSEGTAIDEVKLREPQVTNEASEDGSQMADESSQEEQQVTIELEPGGLKANLGAGSAGPNPSVSVLSLGKRPRSGIGTGASEVEAGTMGTGARQFEYIGRHASGTGVRCSCTSGAGERRTLGPDIGEVAAGNPGVVNTESKIALVATGKQVGDALGFVGLSAESTPLQFLRFFFWRFSSEQGTLPAVLPVNK